MERVYKNSNFKTRWILYSCAGSLLSRLAPVTEECCIMHVGLNATHAFKTNQRMYVEHGSLGGNQAY